MARDAERPETLTIMLPDKASSLDILYKVQDLISGQVLRGKHVHKKYFRHVARQIGKSNLESVEKNNKLLFLNDISRATEEGD